MTSARPRTPAGRDDFEPQVSVSAGTAGQACEVLALVSELFAADPAVSAAAFRFLHRRAPIRNPRQRG